MTRLLTFTDDLTSRSAPSPHGMSAADERVGSPIAQEDAGLVWPPRTPIETYDAEKHQIVSYQPPAESESPHPKRQAPVSRDPEGPTWREALRPYHKPFELVVLALAIVAVVETPYLFLRRAPESPPSAPIPATAPPAVPLNPGPEVPVAAPVADAPATGLASPAPAAAAPATALASPPPAAAERTDAEPAALAPTLPVPPAPGWLSLNLPIQLQIFENGRFVGTSDGSRVMLAAGSHNLELVNESVQFRGQRSILIRPGKVTLLDIELPTGRLQVNAIPWSEVLIDGERVGDTPLGNLQLPIGPHRIVFRHPQFGEQTRTAVIAVGALTRLSVDLRK